MVEHEQTLEDSCDDSEFVPIKDRVLNLLRKNPLLTAKPICQILELDYDHYKSYIDNLRSEWKHSLKVRAGSKADVRASFHRARGWVYVDRLGLDRVRAETEGWILSRNRNRALLWKDLLGRMEWFETGRVNLYVKAPALKGRVFQLFCNGFSFTGLIDSMDVLGKVLNSIRLKSAHAVFDTSQRLPYLTIDLFKLSNGVIIRAGDKSHPTSIEVEFCYPDWAELNERLLGQLRGFLFRSNGNHVSKSREEYVT